MFVKSSVLVKKYKETDEFYFREFKEYAML